MIDSTDDYFAIFMRSNCCRSGNVREVLTCLIFANLARMTNSRIQEYRKNNYNNSAIKEKKKFANSKLREKSQNQKFAKI